MWPFNRKSKKTDPQNSALYRPVLAGENVVFASPVPRYIDIGNLIFEKKYDEAIALGEELLAKAKNDNDKAGIYVNLMVAYFKCRDKNTNYLNLSTQYAKKSILCGHNTGYSHERLAINLEKAEMIHQAIQLCDVVLSPQFKFSEQGCGNLMDFQARKNRLLKKMDKAKDTENDRLFTHEEILSIYHQCHAS